MRLFITNKSKFENEVASSSDIHKKAYNILKNEVEQGKIPINIFAEYYNCEALFRLKSVSENNVYFYEFDSLIS